MLKNVYLITDGNGDKGSGIEKKMFILNEFKGVKKRKKFKWLLRIFISDTSISGN